MKNLIMLTDYKGHFGSKYNAIPYRSGMNKDLLVRYFEKMKYSIKFINFSDITFMENFTKDTFVVYTSSEDIGYFYKDYIEDVVLGLKEKGLTVIPDFKFLRANNNKVFMEILKVIIFSDTINNLSSKHFGVLEDVDLKNLSYPVVIKESVGAMSRGVALAESEKEFLKKAKKIGRTAKFNQDLRDFLRAFKQKEYKKDSLYRNKFIVQQFIPELQSDFKILIFGKRYYIFERPVRKNDFRASGSGNLNYVYGSNVECSDRIFDFAKSVFEQADVPHLSIDVAFDGQNYYLLEFQAIYFGTVGQTKADGYYVQKNGKWIFDKNILDIEKVYTDSIDDFLKRKYA